MKLYSIHLISWMLIEECGHVFEQFFVRDVGKGIHLVQGCNELWGS